MKWGRDNIAEKTKNIGCFVSEKEYERIQDNVRKYGFKNTSEYLRCAIEFFDERRYNASKHNELNIIQDCIDLLHDHKKGVSNMMMQQSLKDIGENLEGQPSSDNENLEGISEKPSKNLEGLSEKTLKESGQNLEGFSSSKKENGIEPFDNVIQTLIRITKSKGRATKEDFTFQAQRCGKRTSEVKRYYEENYEFFVRESEKLR